MSLINKFKSLLPISSRSFHAAEKHFVTQTNLVKDELFDIQLKQDELLARIKHANSGIDGITAKCADIYNILEAETERNKLRMEALFRKAYPNDTPAETRRRIFSLLPEAEGNARIMQKANARLMFELDALCKKANLPYWTSFGSLVGALSRNGFIPWDDDIDICMMREDIDKLEEICANNPDFQLTLVYDSYVFCRQVRFSSRNPHIPCFVDVCIWDWAPSSSKSKDDALRSLRVELMDAFTAKMDEFPYWGERGLLYSPDSGSVAQCIQIERDDQDDKKAALEIESIEMLFSTYQEKARAAGLLCSKDKATAVAYGLDNLFNAPWRKILYPASMMFPVKTHAFEGGFIDIPNDAYSVADECSPGWPYLPDDILGHKHFTEGVLNRPETEESLLRFIES